MAITANVTNGKLDKTNTTPTQNRKTSSAKASGSNLGYDDFLKLLSAEMQYQDPLEPTSNTDYVAQMATFSQLEATLSMKESMASSNDQTTKSAALSLVGKEVIVTDKDSASGYYSGKVDYVTYKDGKIQLSINEKMYDYSSLYSVSTELWQPLTSRLMPIRRKSWSKNWDTSLSAWPTAMLKKLSRVRKIRRIRCCRGHRWLRLWGTLTMVRLLCWMPCARQMLPHAKPAVLPSISVHIRL